MKLFIKRRVFKMSSNKKELYGLIIVVLIINFLDFGLIVVGVSGLILWIKVLGLLSF